MGFFNLFKLKSLGSRVINDIRKSANIISKEVSHTVVPAIIHEAKELNEAAREGGVIGLAKKLKNQAASTQGLVVRKVEDRASELINEFGAGIKNVAEEVRTFGVQQIDINKTIGAIKRGVRETEDLIKRDNIDRRIKSVIGKIPSAEKQRQIVDEVQEEIKRFRRGVLSIF